MLISELFDAICWEISVESGSTDFQLVDDITDEWIIFCVFEHRFSMLDGLFIHCGVVARIGCQVLTQAFATTTDMLNAA